MKEILFVIFLIFLSVSFASAQTTISRNDSKQLLEKIKKNYDAGEYQEALDSCVYLIIQRSRLTSDDVFDALYYAGAISIYNGDPTFSQAYISQAKDYLPVDTVICNKHSRYRLLWAEYLTESGQYEAAKDSLATIRNSLNSCSFQWKFITQINYHRTKARFIAGKGVSSDTLLLEIDSLEQISCLIADNGAIVDSARLQMYITLYQAEIHWLNAWTIYDNNIIKETAKNKLISDNANNALRNLDSLDLALSNFKKSEYKRIQLLSKILRAQILGHIRLQGEPISSPVISDMTPYEPEKAISILLECLDRKKDFQVFKEYAYLKHLIRQLILMYWEYRNTTKSGKEQYIPLDTVLSELYPQRNYFSIRSVYGHLPTEALMSGPVLRQPSYEAVAREQSLGQKDRDLSEKERSLETRYVVFWGVLFLLLLPFVAVLYLMIRFARQSAQIRKKDAELEAALNLIEELNEEQAETSEELGGAKSDAKFQIRTLETKVAQKEEDIKYLKMELSHRLVNQLLYLSSTIESDAEDKSIDRETLTSNAVTKLRNAIKLQRVLEDYDNRTSVYFPAYFNALEEVVNQAFHMRINLDCAELGVENQVPYDFARDLGQLIIEWLFLLADIPVDKIRVFAEPTSDQLKLSIIISEDDWKKMGAPMDFSALEQENSRITKKISFYLSKYRRGEAALLTVSQNKSQTSLTSLLNF